MQQPSPKTEIRDGWITYVALPLASLPPGARVRLQQLGTRACELRRELDQLPAATSKSEAAELKGDYAALQVELAELEAELRGRYGVATRRPIFESVAPMQELAQ
jgi:hypothetical protein